MNKSLILFIVLACTMFYSCGGSSASSHQTGTGGAEQVTDLGFKIPKNSKGKTVEQQNVVDRLKVTTDPTKVLWNHLIALDGTIIRRMPVRCKVTSSGKRLEARTASGNGGQYKRPLPDTGKYYTEELLQPDGTFGGSDNYIYWFDPMGRYHQYGTAGGIGYLITDYPIDLEDPVDVVTGLYKMSKVAKEWQDAEEAKLRKKEGK
jgi:hypothetical protein